MKKFKLILLFTGLIITGIIIFNEVLTTKKIIGMILIIVASLLIIDYKKWTASKKGIIL
jgi:multidrug transporter EmrE-like cation transporter